MHQFGFQIPDGDFITGVVDFIGRPIEYPVHLPPGGEATVMYGVEHLRVALDGRQFGRNVRPFVETGHGRFEGPAIDLNHDVDVILRNT